MRKTDTKAAALDYAKLGWLVLPVHSIKDGKCTCGNSECSHPGKHPRTQNGVYDATSDQEWIADNWPDDANVAVATGSESGLLVLDVDPRNGGTQSLADLVTEHGALPTTVAAETGGGGQHLYFQQLPESGIPGRIGIRPGLDLKSDGGYVVAPGSTHVSGGGYRWRPGQAPHETAIVPATGWLVELTRERPRKPRDTQTVEHTQPTTSRELLLEAARQYVTKSNPAENGDRNNSAFKLAGHIAAFVTDDGLSLAEADIFDLLADSWNNRNDDPLPEHELRQAVLSATRNGTPREPHLVRVPVTSSPSTSTGSQDSQTEVKEVDATRIVRPELIIVENVTGISVPVTLSGKNGMRRICRTYLQYADGRRDCQTLGESLDSGDGSHLFLRPSPLAELSLSSPGWSRPSRESWLSETCHACDPAELFQEITARFAHFIDWPKHMGGGIVATLALWVILTYVYVAWEAVPYLHFSGALGSGKSRMLDILFRLVFRPLLSSNLTGPALFRTLHAQGGTLLLDETERLRERSPGVSELNSMLLAGYRRGGQATRLVGETYKTMSFDVYGPKALACIARLPAPLSSRCISVGMARCAPGSDKPRRRLDEDPSGWQSLRDDLHITMLQYGSEFLELSRRTDVCPNLNGRNYELWQPLLAIAAWIEDAGADGLLGLVQEHALRSVEDSQDQQTPDCDEVLLRILATATRTRPGPRPSDILAQAKEEDQDMFRSWNAKTVSSHLKHYGLATHKTNGVKRYTDVTMSQLRDIQLTYSIDLGVEEMQ